MLEEQGGGVDTGSLEDRFEDPLCIVASTPYPPRTSSWQDSHALNPDSADGIVDNNKHIIDEFEFD